MSLPLRSRWISRAVVVVGLLAGSASADAQYRRSGRYDLPAPTAETERPRESPFYERVPVQGEPVVHGSWPTHAMHDASSDIEPVSGRQPALDGDPTRDDVPLHGATRGGHSVEPIAYPQAPDTFQFPPEPPLRSEVRQRVWQPRPTEEVACDEGLPWIVPYQTTLKATVLPGSGNELGLTDLDARLTLAVPSWSGFTVTPGGVVSFVNGPIRTDLPADVYSVWVEFQYMTQLSRQWSVQLAVAPGLYTDFEDVTSDTVRITGRALAFYGISLQTQFAFGVVYLDREDISVLPAAGVIHSPTEDLRLEILFPRPRVLYRVQRGAGNTGESEGWIYLAGELGGGSWQIQRVGGANDIATYGDLRMLAGYEWRATATRTWFAEAGWVFNRSLEYQSGRGDYDPDDTGLLRAGMTF